MQTLLITIAGPQQQFDLQVPGDLLLSDLLPSLLALCVPSATNTPRDTQRSSWRLLYRQRPLPLERSLIDAAVVDGSLLTLQNQEQQMTQPLAPAEPVSQYFTPRTVTPGRSTGGIGITWSSEGLANEK